MFVCKALLVYPYSKTLATDIETADTFIKHFETTYNKPIDRGTYSGTLPRVVESLDNIQVSEQLISQKLELLDITKAPGLDNIHPILLKKFYDYFAIFLYHIFSKSIQTGSLPAGWKNANIIP